MQAFFIWLYVLLVVFYSFFKNLLGLVMYINTRACLHNKIQVEILHVNFYAILHANLINCN